MYYFLLNPDSVLGHIILSGLTSYLSKDFLLKLKLIEKIKYFLHENLNRYKYKNFKFSKNGLSLSQNLSEINKIGPIRIIKC